MERLSPYLAEQRAAILEHLRSLVEVNSFTGNREGVNRVGDAVARVLAELGFVETRHARQAIGDHRHFTRAGAKDAPRVLFSCHLDTVFPPELGFDRCRIGDDVTTGPGVIDMKGGIVVLLEALRMLDRLALRPRASCTIFFAADEETGSEDARELIERAAAGQDYALVFECGGAQGQVVTARKGVGTFRLEIEGKAAHAGNDYARGINANLEAAHQLLAIQALTDLEAGTTVNVGRIEGGIGANTISPSASLVIDVRYRTPAEADRVVAALQALASRAHVPGAKARLGGRIQRPVMVETDRTRAFADRVRAASGGMIGTEQRGGVGDANLIAARGVPTLDGFGPLGAKDHTPEEYMYTRSLFERIELLARILVDLDARPAAGAPATIERATP